MDTKSDEELLVIEATIEANKQEANKNQVKDDDFRNPNHVLNTLISSGYLHINAHMRHISPLLIPQT